MNDNLIILTLENYWQLYIYVMCLLSTTFRECFTFTFELVSSGSNDKTRNNSRGGSGGTKLTRTRIPVYQSGNYAHEIK